ncbi:MAG: acetyl xylan esterase [Paenibacillus sp.]|nr:acetyl xylan esterase [Paenibacillus sp.]
MYGNPIIWADYPDPDVIRVEDTYYLASTTMHMMPGCVILRSYDLIHWETAAYVYDVLDNTPRQRLEDGGHIYGKGMWAPCLRHRQGTYYVVFAANDTGNTYLYTAEDVTGPWSKRRIEGFYHDCSLLFDDDGKVYMVYGNADIRLIELDGNLAGPKPGGVERVIVRDTEPYLLGYEGAHFYKINGKYYVFLIHISTARGRRTQACYVADSLNGEFRGGEVFNDDMGYFGSGVAQGGIVDTPDGDWYAMLFQDHGAVGRIPVIVPLRFEDGYPVFAKEAPRNLFIPSTKPEYVYKPLIGSDDFHYGADAFGTARLKDFWQWNHTPKETLWSVADPPGAYRIRTGRVSPNLTFAVNTLTQRAVGPACEAVVTVDGSGLKDGDYAGLAFLIGTYGFISLTREDGKLYLAMASRSSEDASMSGNLIDREPAVEHARVAMGESSITLKACGNFVDNADTCTFSYWEQGEWKPLGPAHKLVYKLDHFMGCRIGLFLFSTRSVGGTAAFTDFRYRAVDSRRV